MRARIRLTLLAAALAAGGCTVGPDYVKPAIDAPAAWRIDYAQAADVANTRWWEQFDDPVLTGLIESALQENRDLVIAAARVDAFIGTLRVDAVAVLSAGELQRRREPQPRTSAVGVSPLPAGRRPVLHPLQRARLARSGRSTSSDACAARPRPRRRRCTRPSRDGAASCCRWSRAWRRATSRCARSTGSSRSRSRRPPTMRTPSADLRAALQGRRGVASSRSRRSSRSTSRRWPRSRSSSSRSPRRRT